MKLQVLLKALKALADGNRLRLLRLLLDQPRCVCELQAALGITQPSISKHLRILEEAGLVTKTRQGQFIDYQLAAAPDPADQRAALLALITPWLRADPELQDLSRRASGLKREQLCRSEAQNATENASSRNEVRAAASSGD
ncbi:MAG: hypothetical protein BZ151_08380 [Desulfobacca sp. 4484_104]|nr:MAG: hypothetical protein BZ151_08380 [Desulfobacca sp. 4484_104]